MDDYVSEVHRTGQLDISDCESVRKKAESLNCGVAYKVDNPVVLAGRKDYIGLAHTGKFLPLALDKVIRFRRV